MKTKNLKLNPRWLGLEKCKNFRFKLNQHPLRFQIKDGQFQQVSEPSLKKKSKQNPDYKSISKTLITGSNLSQKNGFPQ